VGGLGIYFMRKMSDSLAYRREGHRNILIITTKMQFKVIYVDETDSTNRWLRDYPAEGEAVVVVADYQTAGRGCGANKWESERGKNLTFSLLLHPELVPANEQFRITEWVSVALCETIEHYIYNKVEIKWPNDIYVENRKLCGILIENRLTGSCIKDSIIGIGLNVNQQTFRSDAPNPVSIRQLVGKDSDRDKLLADFLRQLGNVMELPDVSETYRQRLWRREGMHPFRDAEGEFCAKIAGVEADGHLVLEDSRGKERKYAFKEVEWILSFTN